MISVLGNLLGDADHQLAARLDRSVLAFVTDCFGHSRKRIYEWDIFDYGVVS